MKIALARRMLSYIPVDAIGTLPIRVSLLPSWVSSGVLVTAPAVLTSLGWSNYQLGKYVDAVGFYKQCLSFGGIYKEQAEKNLAAIKAEHNIPE